MMGKDEKTDGDYEVGYGKPPENTRFKKGQSGNPKGRPKGSRNFSTDLKATLEQPVRINSGGTFKSVSTQLAALQRLREKALKGDARALERLLAFASTYNDEETAETAKLSRGDKEILADYMARQQRVVDQPESTGNGEVPEEPNANTEAPERETVEEIDEDDDDDFLR